MSWLVINDTIRSCRYKDIYNLFRKNAVDHDKIVRVVILMTKEKLDTLLDAWIMRHLKFVYLILFFIKFAYVYVCSLKSEIENKSY